MRIRCLAQEHNTMSLPRGRIQTARSGVERTNHETTAPPTKAASILYGLQGVLLFLINEGKTSILHSRKQTNLALTTKLASHSNIFTRQLHDY